MSKKVNFYDAYSSNLPTGHRIGTAADRAAWLALGRLDKLSRSPKLSMSIISQALPPLSKAYRKVYLHRVAWKSSQVYEVRWKISNLKKMLIISCGLVESTVM